MAKTYIAEKAVMVITFYIHAHTFICDLSYYQFCTLYVLYYRGRHNSFNRDLFVFLYVSEYVGLITSDPSPAPFSVDQHDRK